MSIIIKKKKQYNKKKLIQRITILIIIYFASFFILYAFWPHKSAIDTAQKETEIVYANEGEKALAEENYAFAIEYFLRKIDENPEDYKAMTNLAIGYTNVNEMEKAKFYLYKSSELAPNYTLNYIQFANIYIAQKNYNIAEDAIDIIPLKTDKDFIEKANLLIKLANTETDVEEKIIHYNKALKYLKKYKPKEYNEKTELLINLLLQLADQDIAQKDYQSAKTIFTKIERHKDNCYTRNMLALRYKDIGQDKAAIQNLAAAVKLAKTQKEKRLTKETIITLKYYFEKKSDKDAMKNINAILSLLNESTILVDEKYTPISVVNDKFEIIKSKKKLYPQVTFAVLNKSQKNIPTLFAKLEIYTQSNNLVSNEIKKIVNEENPLKPNQETNLNTLEILDNINHKKLKNYNLGLSFSFDGEIWQLYRLYNE